MEKPQQNESNLADMYSSTSKLSGLLSRLRPWPPSAKHRGQVARQNRHDRGPVLLDFSEWEREQTSSQDGLDAVPCCLEALTSASQSPMRLDQASLRQHEREGQIDGRLITRGTRGPTARWLLEAYGRPGAGESNLAIQTLCASIGNKWVACLRLHYLAANACISHDANRGFPSFLSSGHGSSTKFDRQTATRNATPLFIIRNHPDIDTRLFTRYDAEATRSRQYKNRCHWELLNWEGEAWDPNCSQMWLGAATRQELKSWVGPRFPTPFGSC